MAHQIETHGTRAAALFARTDPWHRLGTTVAGASTTTTSSTLPPDTTTTVAEPEQNVKGDILPDPNQSC